MKRISRPALFGLLWTTFAGAAFAATDAVTVRPVPEPAIFLLTGAFLILLGLMPRRRKS